MRTFRHWIETEEGLLVRKTLAEHYSHTAGTENEECRRHYDRFFTRFPLVREREFSRVFAIGGGHPRFEAYLNTSEIVVCDPQADLYKESVDAYRAVFDFASKVTFKKSNALQLLGGKTRLDGCALTFVHVLEHMSIDEMREVLTKAAASPAAAVIIYMPNGDAVPDHDDGWLHLTPPDHLVIPGLKWLTKVGTEIFGRPPVEAAAHDTDMFLWWEAEAKPEDDNAEDAAEETDAE